MFYCVILTLLVSGGQCANILGVFLYPGLSHRILYQKISTELSLRGHNITIVTPHPLNNSSLTNLTEINITFINDVLKKIHVQDKFARNISPYKVFQNAYDLFNKLAELILNSSQFRTFISKTQKFDLILIHSWHPVMYGLGARYKAPVISTTSADAFSVSYDAVGDPNHPVLSPAIYFNFRPEKATFLEKLRSFVFGLQQKFYYHWVVLPRAHSMAETYFGKIPYIGDLEKNVSMLFVYRNVLMEIVRPHVPAVLDLYFINNEPLEALPDDLQTILDTATNGAIYISFGSSVQTGRFAKNLKNSILEALPELSYTILLKWDSDDSFVESTNVVVRTWYPQTKVLGMHQIHKRSDILSIFQAHPNVKAFVTHGGVQSSEEAILNEVPLIGIPFFADQPKNVRGLVELGIAEELDPSTINKTVFRNTIIKVAENLSYKEKIRKVRKILLDRSMTSLESAVWWCEYVIRHKGIKHSRSLARDLSFFEYLLFDVILLVFLCLVLILCILIKTKI